MVNSKLSVCLILQPVITKASKTVTASNLPISVDKSHVIDFFKQVGDIVDVRVYLYKHAGGQLRAHSAIIEFATEEAARKAKKFHRLDLLCRTIRLSPPLEGTRVAKKLVMKDIPFKTDESDVIKFFKQAGDIVDVCFFYNADEHSRSAHIEFVSEESAMKAERLNGLDLLGSCVGLRRQAKGTGEPKTVCLKNAPLSIDKSHVIDFFKDVGDVADVRFSYDKYGTFRGVVHVEFATEEAAKEAVKLNGEDLKGCPVELGIVRETVCVKGFDTSSDQIQSILIRHFRTCRYIVHIDILKDQDTGVPLGTALIRFSSLQAFHLALELDGQEVDGTSLSIKDYVPVEVSKVGSSAKPKVKIVEPKKGDESEDDDSEDSSDEEESDEEVLLLDILFNT
ncbi:hypothetical protein MKW92_021892 [Papaver armeniacum]|nr:hypothetical protein MKW92_021892 [Papaver armeniacum]